MTSISKDPWRRSRITKAIVDSGTVSDFDLGEALLKAVSLVIVVDNNVARTAAGQAALLTAVATSFRCFEHVAVFCDPDTSLIRPLLIGSTLGEAVAYLGGDIVSDDEKATHRILIGSPSDEVGFAVRCWWDGWKAGVLPAGDRGVLGAGWHPLSGVAAGALAVREVFSAARGNQRAGRRRSVISLWEPLEKAAAVAPGPDSFAFPSTIWMIGLGHLGQGMAWSLGLLPTPCDSVVTLQDDQLVEPENEATSLLVCPRDLGRPKTRVTADWLEFAGWKTRLVERRHYGDLRLAPPESGLALCGLDNPEARQLIAASGFDWIIDAGVGHGAGDFERLQIKVIMNGQAQDFWSSADSTKNIEALLQMPAYSAYDSTPGVCGAFPLAAASVAVPFVGAFVGALALATAARIACLEPVCRAMLTELGAPDFVTSSDLIIRGQPVSSRILHLS